MWPPLRTGRHRVSRIFLARRARYLMMTNENNKGDSKPAGESATGTWGAAGSGVWQAESQQL